MKNYADNSSYQTQPHSTTVTVAHTCKKNPLSSRIFDFVFGKKRENTVYVAYNNSFSTSFPGVSNVYLSEAIILKWMSCYFVFFKLWKFSYCDQCLYFNTFLIKVIQELKDFGFKNSLCSKLVFIRGTNKWPCRKRNHKAPISRKCLSTS